MNLIPHHIFRKKEQQMQQEKKQNLIEEIDFNLFLNQNHFLEKQEIEVVMVPMKSSINQMIELKNQELKFHQYKHMVEFQDSFLMGLVLTQTENVQEILQ